MVHMPHAVESISREHTLAQRCLPAHVIDTMTWLISEGEGVEGEERRSRAQQIREHLTNNNDGEIMYVVVWHSTKRQEVEPEPGSKGIRKEDERREESWRVAISDRRASIIARRSSPLARCSLLVAPC